jgi:hypothetical protein
MAESELTDVTAKVIIYEAFVEASWKLPNTLPAVSMISTSSRGMRNSGRAIAAVQEFRWHATAVAAARVSRGQSREWQRPVL